MAGANVETGKRGSRRALDSDINMIPMIDLLMVTISFLLLTAVWVRMERLQADAQTPGDQPCAGDACKAERVFHLDMHDKARFVTWWTVDGQEKRRAEIPRREVVELVNGAKLVRYPGLVEALKKEWTEMGTHRAEDDHGADRAALHTDDAASYAEIVAAMDAVHGVTRSARAGRAVVNAPAFALTFAVK